MDELVFLARPMVRPIVMPIPRLSGTAVGGASTADCEAVGTVRSHVRFRREAGLEVEIKAICAALTTLGIDELEETKGGGDMNGTLANELYNALKDQFSGRCGPLVGVLENRSADNDVHLWNISEFGTRGSSTIGLCER